MYTFIETGSTNPYYNLAFEEYCLKNLPFAKIFMLWQNDNTVVVGRYQNALAEINMAEVERIGTRVVRRSTGGGAVYHDLGNVNYSLISTVNDPSGFDFKTAAIPLVEALHKIGIPAEVKGRNDIVLDDKKISGTAQCLYQNRLLHHGTLLYDSELSKLGKLLAVDSEKLQSNGVKSVRSRVTNIKEHMGWNLTTAEFQDVLKETFVGMQTYQLTADELKKVQEIHDEKYVTWEWNVGSEPAFTYHNKVRFSGGVLETSFDIEKGYISRCAIQGDFLGLDEIAPLQNSITGAQFNRDEIEKRLSKLSLSIYVGGITQQQLLDCMFGAI